MEWKHYKMDELIEEISMGPFGSDVKKEFYVDNGVPILNGSNLQGFKLQEDSFGYLTKEKADSLKKCNAHRGDIIVTHRGTLGQIVYVPVDSKYDRYVISQSQFRFRCKADLVDVQYLVYYFHTREGQYKILANASQVGVPALARATSTFRLIDIKLPPLDDQRRIASILSSLDRKIELNNKINADLEEMAQAIFKNWFVDFEPFKDGKFVDSELGMIPEGWKVGCLGDMGAVVCGKTPSKSNSNYYGGDIPFIKIPDMHGNVFVENSEDRLTEEGSLSQIKKLIPPYSLMVSCIATVGLVSINTKPSHTNQQINTVIPHNKSALFYLYQHIKNNEEFLKNMGRGGTTTLNVNTKSFSNIRLLIPSEIALEQFHGIVEGLFKKIEQNLHESRTLSLLRDTLLPRLMSGELEVPE
mgnify:CR=1 FL=1